MKFRIIVFQAILLALVTPAWAQTDPYNRWGHSTLDHFINNDEHRLRQRFHDHLLTIVDGHTPTLVDYLAWRDDVERNIHTCRQLANWLLDANRLYADTTLHQLYLEHTVNPPAAVEDAVLRSLDLWRSADEHLATYFLNNAQEHQDSPVIECTPTQLRDFYDEVGERIFREFAELTFDTRILRKPFLKRYVDWRAALESKLIYCSPILTYALASTNYYADLALKLTYERFSEDPPASLLTAADESKTQLNTEYEAIWDNMSPYRYEG